VRDDKIKSAEFERGTLVKDEAIVDSTLRRGTQVVFTPDEKIFGNFHF